MYVTTFYSYKGGVGRTLALLNVAYELAASGQKVLVVDFDLEAPAIHSDTWGRSGDGRSDEEGRASSTHSGIVEYVARYMNTMRAPRAEDYIVDATPADCAGTIALMPSGKLDDGYPGRLSAIDWNELYRQYDGYVMFEDLREQWRVLGYDYVLLDSRTGVTDVGGICTRHLPDAVVMMFRPDDQSFEGTAGIVDAIRNERPAPGRDRVQLHFVMAAIPEADDEHGILGKLRGRFLKRLGIAPPRRLLEIRNYQSMDLLTQPIYTLLRPRTKLARSYQELTRRIRSANIGDRDGVLEYLEQSRRSIFESQDDVLDRIADRYSDDRQVLGKLAAAYEAVGLGSKAIDLLEQIAESGTLAPRQLITLARGRRLTADRLGSLRALRDFFRNEADRPRDGYYLVSRALMLLEMWGEDRGRYVDGSPIVARLPVARQAAIAGRLDRSRRERRVQIRILERVLNSGEGLPADKDNWAGELAFARVAVGDFAPAAEYYRTKSSSTGGSVQAAFNLAMADWGDSGSPDPDAFRRVLDRREGEKMRERQRHGPNYLQAIAVAEWFVDRGDEARQHLAEARRRLSAAAEPAAPPHPRHRSAVSCWSFTRVSAGTFVEHCDEIGRLFDGCDVKPVFMRAAQDPEADLQATSSSVSE